MTAAHAWRSLTAAEREVATLAESGLSTRAIAERRGTSPRTVARQLTSIYTKLGARSRRELLALPGRAGPARSGS
nr:helix-turn-helix transcriptional regulator [Myxococcus sp. RHSTA-1-4]